MRIAFLGNVANFSYRVAKALQAETDLDIHLYLDEKTPLASRPEGDDPELKGRYPGWIHVGDLFAPRRVYPVLLPWTAPVVRELRTFDLLIVSAEGPVVAQFCGRPYCFLVNGADVNVKPFPLRQILWAKPKFHNAVAGIVLAYWQRRGIRRATEIWAQPFAMYRQSLRDLGVESSRITSTYFPMIIQTQRFKPDENVRRSPDPNIRQIVERFDFVVFHPTRLVIQAAPRLKAVGQWKANDILIKGFARFLEQSGSERAGLVIPEVGISRDVPLAKALIRELGIESQVFWAKAPRPEAFTRDELIPYYSLADVVAADFGAGAFGGVALEGLAFGRPVLNYLDEAAMRQLYPWHPMLSANTPEGVADHLLRLYHDPAGRRAIGQKSREWIETFHSPENASQVYVRHITDLVQRYAQTTAAR